MGDTNEDDDLIACSFETSDLIGCNLDNISNDNKNNIADSNNDEASDSNNSTSSDIGKACTGSVTASPRNSNNESNGLNDCGKGHTGSPQAATPRIVMYEDSNINENSNSLPCSFSDETTSVSVESKKPRKQHIPKRHSKKLVDLTQSEGIGPNDLNNPQGDSIEPKGEGIGPNNPNKPKVVNLAQSEEIRLNNSNNPHFDSSNPQGEVNNPQVESSPPKGEVNKPQGGVGLKENDLETMDNGSHLTIENSTDTLTDSLNTYPQSAALDCSNTYILNNSNSEACVKMEKSRKQVKPKRIVNSDLDEDNNEDETLTEDLAENLTEDLTENEHSESENITQEHEQKSPDFVKFTENTDGDHTKFEQTSSDFGKMADCERMADLENGSDFHPIIINVKSEADELPVDCNSVGLDSELRMGLGKSIQGLQSALGNIDQRFGKSGLYSSIDQQLNISGYSNIEQHSQHFIGHPGGTDHDQPIIGLPGTLENLELFNKLSPSLLRTSSSLQQQDDMEYSNIVSDVTQEIKDIEVIRQLREMRCNKYRKISVTEKREISDYAKTNGVSRAALMFNVSKSAVSMWTRIDLDELEQLDEKRGKNCMLGNRRFEELCARVQSQRANKYKYLSRSEKFEVSRYAKLVGVREMARCLGVALGTVSGWMRQFPYTGNHNQHEVEQTSEKWTDNNRAKIQTQTWNHNHSIETVHDARSGNLYMQQVPESDSTPFSTGYTSISNETLTSDNKSAAYAFSDHNNTCQFTQSWSQKSYAHGNDDSAHIPQSPNSRSTNVQPGSTDHITTDSSSGRVQSHHVNDGCVRNDQIRSSRKRCADDSESLYEACVGNDNSYSSNKRFMKMESYTDDTGNNFADDELKNRTAVGMATSSGRAGSSCTDELDNLIAETMYKPPDIDKLYEEMKPLMAETELEGNQDFRELFSRVVRCKGNKYKNLLVVDKIAVCRYGRLVGVRRVGRILGLATGTLSGWNSKYDLYLSTHGYYPPASSSGLNSGRTISSVGGPSLVTMSTAGSASSVKTETPGSSEQTTGVHISQTQSTSQTSSRTSTLRSRSQTLPYTNNLDPYHSKVTTDLQMQATKFSDRNTQNMSSPEMLRNLGNPGVGLSQSPSMSTSMPDIILPSSVESDKSEVTAIKCLFKERYAEIMSKFAVARTMKFKNISVKEKIEIVKCSKLVGIRPTARVMNIPIGTLSGWIAKYSNELHPVYNISQDQVYSDVDSSSSGLLGDGFNANTAAGLAASYLGMTAGGGAMLPGVWPTALWAGLETESTSE